MGRYEPVAKPRFAVELGEGGETIVINARKAIFALLFLPIWLIGWSFGGISAINQLLTQFEPFLIVWLCLWAIGWLFASGTIAWMLFGRQTLRVVNQDLEVAVGIAGLKRAKLYRGSNITNLGVAPQLGILNRFRFPVGPLSPGQSGAVKFDYGPRTIYIADGLDEAEGALIVERLAARLPKTRG